MDNRESKYDLAVIGAGPAGMMAAIRAAECGARVVLLEKNHKPGIKLLMTGKGRCNITNAETDVRVFADHFGRNGKFLLSALYAFGVNETLEFFHKHNVKTIVERGGRVFPEGGSAMDIQGLLIRLIEKNTITLMENCDIRGIECRDGHIEKVILHNDCIQAENYLIATGGLSYPRTGSSGDGFLWAEQTGHKIVRPQPALTPLILREPWVKELEGLSLKNVRISVYQDNKKQDERFGEAIFTANGLSGPVILDMSKTVGELLPKGRTRILIDFKPALDFAALEKRIMRDFEANRNRAIKNIMSGLLPKKLIPVMLRTAHIDPDKKSNSVTRDERRRLRLLLKEFPFTVRKLLGFEKAVITTGGVSLKDVDSRTMRSKKVDNLFFAGEVLDLDGPTGGFNLQVCWSTGYIAGQSAAQGKRS